MALPEGERRMSRGLEEAARRFGEHDALRFGDQRLTYGELDRLSNAFAAVLRSRGISAGQRVAVMTSNRPEFIIAVFAVSKLNAAPVLISPAWKAREVGHALQITSAAHAIAEASTASLVSAGLGPERVYDLDAEPLLGGGLEGADAAPDPGPVSESDEAVLVFSSGTTGLPKAVRHTHTSICAGTTHWVQCLGLGPDDRFQVATPPSHILGLLNLLAAAEAGATVRLHPRFDLDEVLRRIQQERVTLEMAVAPIALALANHPRLEDYDLSSLRYIMWGATPVTQSVAETVTARSGVRWLCGYGASEVPVIAVNPVREPGRWRLDSAGLPAEGLQLRVADLETGRVLGPGETGEVQIRGASVMAGYLPEEANADAFADGWYRTGDVGWLEPEGWVHLTDRSKEMIKVKGFQVAPAEIEAVLHGHPGVLDCAVFGVPDESAGEMPVAAVSLDPKSPVTAEELQQLVADSLAGYKRLRDVIVVEEIPRLPSGKVLRRMLRDTWAPILEARGDATRTVG
ncbi:MAG TPA: AMP-binding protein [Frankiaceae bacterium]|nr:AMP-binding protein [Frankiaceae bacterium]